MSIHVYILGAIVVGLVTLGIWILRHYQRSPSILYYAGFLFALSLIALASLGTYLDLNVDSLTLVNRFGAFSGVLTFSMMLMFSWHYPIPSKNIPANSNLFWIVPLAFFLPYILLTNVFISGVGILNGHPTEIRGSGYWVFPVFVLVYFIWFVVNFATKLKYVHGTLYRDTLTFMWLVILSAAAGVLFDVVLPALGSPRIPLGIYSAIGIVGLSTYIVLKKA